VELPYSRRRFPNVYPLNAAPSLSVRPLDRRHVARRLGWGRNKRKTGVNEANVSASGCYDIADRYRWTMLQETAVPAAKCR